MPENEKISEADKEVINKLLLELATELDLHYNDEDMFALTPSFSVIKDGVKLLNRVGYPVHPDVKRILARFNKSHQ
ncbi:MAG: hypothetical protein E5X40_06660 [Mesorhizobium sp.]|nr:MAG: hypothetical protein EOQ80_04550 [Mesorhizobium sp.]RWJ56810.1 MAG: hypothetical protein EOR32_33220 [Mesorhizobium sp.]RWJ74263.1 MAG: hypothetical protein EOR34_10255 [Mesorhizobium sp.]TIQ74045.1 MAG: hypothetical protein E5X40_06660 [Mesorhizobium sp.]